MLLLRTVQRSVLRPQVINTSFLKTAPSTTPLFTLPILSRAIATTPHLRISSTLAETSTPISPPPETLSTTQSNATPTVHESLALLTALKAQPSKYITVKIQGFSFLVTPGDKIELPFLLKDAKVGDTLRLTHATTLGSRDYTMKGNPYIDERLFECRATFLEGTAEPLREKKKKKRRTRKTKTVKSKHRYSVLRIKELIINDVPPAVEAAGGSTIASGIGGLKARR
ncbi:hypothetical protein L873DRAFT_575290 [Choiromyces venosus 120613-1]|uniref:Large ribosomal subunit protein bL21m n=1 Tax=Choiromyces venosus 120613-1 TaxID=1336337 RepID=A0A3N4IUP8_9PEZI|nr:hypothetical protein L873DRAFT_575290 [Choiromyces venosus 120613-1]